MASRDGGQQESNEAVRVEYGVTWSLNLSVLLELIIVTSKIGVSVTGLENFKP